MWKKAYNSSILTAITNLWLSRRSIALIGSARWYDGQRLTNATLHEHLQLQVHDPVQQSFLHQSWLLGNDVINGDSFSKKD